MVIPRARVVFPRARVVFLRAKVVFPRARVVLPRARVVFPGARVVFPRTTVVPGAVKPVRSLPTGGAGMPRRNHSSHGSGDAKAEPQLVVAQVVEGDNEGCNAPDGNPERLAIVKHMFGVTGLPDARGRRRRRRRVS